MQSGSGGDERKKGFRLGSGHPDLQRSPITPYKCSPIKVRKCNIFVLWSTMTLVRGDRDSCLPLAEEQHRAVVSTAECLASTCKTLVSSTDPFSKTGGIKSKSEKTVYSLTQLLQIFR